MTASVLPFAEVDNSLAAALEERGVKFPFGGFAPGHYVQTCSTCGKRHTAAKNSINCLPCAVVVAVDVGLRACESQRAAFDRGHKAALASVSAFVAAGARSWKPVWVEAPAKLPGVPRVTGPSDRRPVTEETRASIKVQAREADRHAGAAEVERLVAITEAARERIKAERHAAETADADPDGGDAA